MYFKKINKISNIPFTPRELEVIACILHIRGAKKIANILDLSPRTIEGYIQTILTKINRASQECIKDFVEYSSELQEVKKHYINLQIKYLFNQQIKKISSKVKKEQISCVVNYQDNKNLVCVSKIFDKLHVKMLQQSNDDYSLIELNTANLIKLKDSDVKSNIIFICFDQSLISEISKSSNIQIMDCSSEELLYTSIFRIIQILAPKLCLNEEISKFDQLKSNVKQLNIDLYNEESNFKITEKPWVKRKMIMLSIVISITVLCICISGMLYYTSYKKNNFTNSLGMNFLLPNQTILLPREALNLQLEKLLNNNEDINIAVLLGVGGSGKTTIARNYAKQQKSSIIWEVNAESANSLSLGMENLAYALCDKIEEKKELRSIFDIKEQDKKDAQLLLFIKSKLRQLDNWLVIYDNIDSVQSIAQYLPNHKETWGNGKVIITTRNSNIKNNNYIDPKWIIDVGEITSDEKLQLFYKITKDLSPASLHTEDMTKNFLHHIPSFPLDVSIAAHYLKDTGMQYNKYIEEISIPKQAFTELQVSILQDTGEYTQTRYNILSLTLKKMLELNIEFSDLYLLLGVLDSQDIPHELLSLYKDEYIANNFIRALKKNSLITNIKYKNPQVKNIDNLASFSIHRSAQSNILANTLSSLSPVKQQESLVNILMSVNWGGEIPRLQAKTSV
jgi:MinD-like ATPase involved in chromosome partitioning or flagellar assembly